MRGRNPAPSGRLELWARLARSGSPGRMVLSVALDQQIFAAQAVGGISRYFVELARALALLPGVRVRIHAPLHVNALLAGQPLPGAGLRLPRFPAVTRVCNAAARVWPAPPLQDVLHETFYGRDNGHLRCRVRVTTVHDMIPERAAQTSQPFRTMAALKKAALARSAHVFCVSACTRDELVELTGMPAERITLTPHGSTLQDVAPRAPAIDRPFFLHVGRREGYKNFDALLEAYASEPRLARDFALVSATADAPDAELRRRAASAGVALVHLAADDAELAWLYRNACALVFPSLQEGFGLPVLEAMACGCPVIAADIAIMRELTPPGSLLVDAREPAALREAMLGLAGDAGERGRLSTLGRAHARTYTWANCAAATLTGYNKALRPG